MIVNPLYFHKQNFHILFKKLRNFIFQFSFYATDILSNQAMQKFIGLLIYIFSKTFIFFSWLVSVYIK